MGVPPLTIDIIVVFALIAVAIVLFVTELLPTDTTAIAILVSLALLEPWTHISTEQALSGFANPATLTIVAMYILSGGVIRTGILSRLKSIVTRIARGNNRNLLAATVGITGPLAGVINNTPIVAVFVPLVTDLADQNHVSPSKLLLPLSYAAMLGGTLTLLGTTTNILASDLSKTLIGHPFSMFEFTRLGVIVLAIGSLYLLTIGQWLIPERIPPLDLAAEFELADHLHQVSVRRDSPLVGQPIKDALHGRNYDLDVVQIIRGDEIFVASRSDRKVEQHDILTVRGTKDAVETFVDAENLRRHPAATVTESDLHGPRGRGTIVECVIPRGSSLAGSTIAEAGLRDRFGVTVLAFRRGQTVIRDDLVDYRLSEGDGLLVHTTYDMLDVLDRSGDVFIAEHANGRMGVENEGKTDAKDEDAVDAITDGGNHSPPAYDGTNALLALGIVGSVIGLSALDVVPIVIAALGGVVAMVVAGIIRPAETYASVNWEVVFLLAGVIPLGMAMQETGGAEFLGQLVLMNGSTLPPIVMLGAFSLLTGLLANVITPVATVALLLPVAVNAAEQIGANQFAFVLAVTFAASTAFMTPMGYQTNMMVYSPGGYRFTDYIRVGAPLQLLLSVVTTVGIVFFWGLQP